MKFNVEVTKSSAWGTPMAVKVNGKPRRKFELSSSCTMFKFSWQRKLYVIKFDEDNGEYEIGGEHDYDHQASRELDLWHRIEEADKRFFSPIVDGAYSTPEQAGYVIKPFLNLSYDLTREQFENLRDVAVKYGVIDLKLHSSDTWNVAQVDGQELIFDFGYWGDRWKGGNYNYKLDGVSVYDDDSCSCSNCLGS